MKYSLLLSAIIMTMSIIGCNNKNEAAAEMAATHDASTVLDAIFTRTSVRTYQEGKTVSPDTVEILLRAAMSAPTAVNKQPWAFVVLDTRESLDSLAEVLPYAKMLHHAPLAIVTCGDMDKALEGNGRDFWIQDVSAATENMLIAAHALGLGAVWTGVYPDMERVEAVQKRLGMPANIIPLSVVPIGYPSGEHQPKDKWNPDAVRYNRW